VGDAVPTFDPMSADGYRVYSRVDRAWGRPPTNSEPPRTASARFLSEEAWYGSFVETHASGVCLLAWNTTRRPI
jgi:hypothetical protein